MSVTEGAWRPARARRWRRRGTLALGALALGAAALLVTRAFEERRDLRRSFPALEGTVVAPGLSARVSIVRDSRGVAHVSAKNQRDALLALGFVHAQDRLAQMVWMVRAARGRTAEVLGATGLPADQLARTLGIGRHADREAGRLDRGTARALEAYAAGVNARIERLRAGLAAPPRALIRLDIPLEPWTPADTLAVGKLLAWGLDGSVAESLVLSDLIERLGGFGARAFFPPEAAGRLAPFLPEQFVDAAPGEPIQSLASLRRAVGLAGRSVGSSAWVVSGALTVSGKPLLAADTHLEPTVPALFHEVHLRARDFDVAGATIPGVPVFWIGRNERVAWATTHARAAVTDLYVETLHPQDRDRYHDGRRWRRLKRREEIIQVRGGAPEKIVVGETAHGPLVNELVGGDREALALAWPGARRGNGVAGFLRAAHARNAAEFRRALAHHHEPVVVSVFADAEGGGGLQVAGWIPDRGMPTGLVPVPGRSGWYDWRGPVPFDQLPRAELASDGGWIIAADNPLGTAREGPAIDWLWRTGARADRIDALLRRAAARGPLDALALAAIQGDVHGAGVVEQVALILELASPLESLPPDAREVASILRAWDGGLDRASVGAAAYHALLIRLIHELLAEPVGEELLERYLRLRTASPQILLGHLLAAARGGRSAVGELADPERARRAVQASLRETGLTLLVRLGVNREHWSWGRLHPLRFRAFGWPESAWGGPVGAGPLPYGGDGVTIAVGEYDPVDPFEVRVASVYRFAVDAGHLELGLTALAPGSMEHAGHPLREAGLEAWLAGRAKLLPTHPILVQEQTSSRLQLEPPS